MHRILSRIIVVVSHLFDEQNKAEILKYDISYWYVSSYSMQGNRPRVSSLPT